MTRAAQLGLVAQSTRALPDSRRGQLDYGMRLLRLRDDNSGLRLGRRVDAARGPQRAMLIGEVAHLTPHKLD